MTKERCGSKVTRRPLADQGSAPDAPPPYRPLAAADLWLIMPQTLNFHFFIKYMYIQNMLKL